MDVSIIILTYCPDYEKLERTIHSVAIQGGDVYYEVILTDDGSENFNLERIRTIFSKYRIEEYQIIRNDVNQGTIKNLIGALEIAKGEYVFATSPGDMLHDRFAICDMYKYAISNGIKILFGNAIYYRKNTEDGLNLIPCRFPTKPNFYSYNIVKSLFVGDDICGACFFRERTTLLSLLREISPVARLVEDYTSTKLALVKNIAVIYYDRDVVYYESGVGVSSNQRGKQILEKDIISVWDYIERTYDGNIIDILYFCRHQKSFLKKFMYVLCKKPSIIIYRIQEIIIPTPQIRYSEADLLELKSMCSCRIIGDS